MQIPDSLIIQALEKALSSPDPKPFYTDPAYLAVLVALFGILIGQGIALYQAIKSVKNQTVQAKHQEKVLIESRNRHEREAIRYRLNEFFGPLRELRAQSAALYSVFASTEREAAAKEKKRFRTLRHLVEGKAFYGADAALLSQILEVGQKQLNLIEMEGWAVDNPRLSELLGRLGGHIRTLSLAAQGKLVSDNDKLADLVFPLEVDGALETAVRRLQGEDERLASDKPTGSYIPNLESSEVKTVNWYNRNAQEYFDRTFTIKMTDQYKAFLRSVPLGGLILDAGCGVGRDTRFFIKRGFRVVSFDASWEMVQLCNRYPFAYCNYMSFEQLTDIETFDGIWANASLLHVAEGKIPGIVAKLCTALKTDGALFMSLKTPEGPGGDQDRATYFYAMEDIERIVADNLPMKLEVAFSNESRLGGDRSRFVNLIYKKTDYVEKV